MPEPTSPLDLSIPDQKDIERTLEQAAAEAKAGLKVREEIDSWLTRRLNTAWERAMEWLGKGPDAFESLNITYHPPHVSRLWFRTTIYNMPYRVYLHRIEAMGVDPAFGAHHMILWSQSKPLFHPHPWPSAIRLLEGVYEHAVGTRDGPVSIGVIGTRPLDSRFPDLGPVEKKGGIRYAMIDPKGWHSVRTFDGPAYTLMITGERYADEVRETEEHSNKAKGKVEGLHPERKLRLWWEFCRLLDVTPGV